MATLAWDRIRAGIGGASARQDEGLRRVGTLLALQTVGLLFVMLIVLEVVVYVTTEQAFQGTLQDALKQSTSQLDLTVCRALQLSCGSQGRFGGFPGQQGPSSGGFGNTGFPLRFFPEPRGFTAAAGPPPNPSDASVVYVDSNGNWIHGDGPHPTSILDKGSIEQVLSDGTDKFSNAPYENQKQLVYTKPIVADGRVIAAVQASISTYQFDKLRHTLLEKLLVVALLGLLISGGISAVLVRRALDPIRTAMQRQRDFVADAAHELRTPLAVQRTVGEVGMNDEAGQDQQVTIEQMLAENRHLTRLVDDLSLLARADTHAVDIDRRPVNFSSLVSDTVAELSPLAEAQGVTLTAQVQGTIDVLGDTLRLRQLLLILTDNALKHTPPEGSVSVGLESSGGRARLQVLDTGSGIDPADLPRIFDRFYRADRARTGEGSGLGLAIGKWIAEAHGGSIQAGNSPNHGAIFTVTLPLARVPVSA